jgi:predicted ATPase
MSNLKSFGLKNFRVFKDQTDFELAPITIVTGTNNAGKSSLSKALLLLSDTMYSNRKDNTFFKPLDFSKGEIHKLGGQKYISNNENDDITFTLDLNFTENVKNISKGWKLEVSYFNVPELLDDYGNNTYGCMKGLKIYSQNGEEIINAEFTIESELIDRSFDGIEKHQDIVTVLTQKYNIKYLVDKLYDGNDYDKNTPLLNAHFYNTIGIELNKKNAYSLAQVEREALSEIIRETGAEVGSTLFFDEYIDSLLNYESWSGTPIENNQFITTLLWVFVGKGYDLNIDSIKIENEKIRIELVEKLKILNQAIDILTESGLNTFDIMEKEKNVIEKYLQKNNDTYDLNTYVPFEIIKSLKCFDNINYKLIQLLKNVWNKGDFSEYHNSSQIQSFKDNIFENFLVKNIENCINEYCKIIYIPRERIHTKRIHTEISNDKLFYSQIEDLLKKTSTFSFTSEKFNYKNKKPVSADIQKTYDFFQKWCEEFEIAGFNSEQITREEDSRKELRLNINTGEGLRNMTDVGYGISQISLLIHSLFHIAENKKSTYTIILEEPETGLHPNFQSKIAEFLVEFQKLTRHQLIIETHSEYFIRKLQLMTAQNKIKSDDTIIHYLFHPKDPQSLLMGEQLRTIRIKENGHLSKEFGSGFLDEADNMALSIYQINMN